MAWWINNGAFPLSSPVQFSSVQYTLVIFVFPSAKVVNGSNKTTPFRPIFLLPLWWGTLHTDPGLKGGARNTAVRWLVNRSVSLLKGLNARTCYFLNILIFSNKACVLVVLNSHIPSRKNMKHSMSSIVFLCTVYVRYIVMLLMWLTWLLPTPTIPSTFKSIFCGGNAKRI